MIDNPKFIYNSEEFLKKEKHHFSADGPTIVDHEYRITGTKEMMSDYIDFFNRYLIETTQIQSIYNDYNPSKDFMDFVLNSYIHQRHNSRIFNARSTQELINIDKALEYPAYYSGERKVIPFGFNARKILIFENDPMFKRSFSDNTLVLEQLKELSYKELYHLTRKMQSAYDPISDTVLLSRDVVNDNWKDWEKLEMGHMMTQVYIIYGDMDSYDFLSPDRSNRPTPLTVFPDPAAYRKVIIKQKDNISILGTIILHENVHRVQSGLDKQYSLDSDDCSNTSKNPVFADYLKSLGNIPVELLQNTRENHSRFYDSSRQIAEEMAYLAEYPENWRLFERLLGPHIILK